MTVSRSFLDDARSAASDYASGAVGDLREAATEQVSDYADQARQTAAGYADQARETVAGYADQAQQAATGALDQARAALPGGARGGGAGDPDKQFEELYDRLKRELMIEQEQLGQLFHEP